MTRTIIFDLDGTLADTSLDMLNAANACFRGLGLGDRLSHPQDAGIAIRGGRAMLRLGFDRVGDGDESQIDALYPVFLKHYAEGLSVHSRFFHGAIEAVEALKSRGDKVGICTNKPEALARRLLDDLGARTLFASLVGGDTLPVRKPDPAPLFAAVREAGGDPLRAVLVGDTETDRVCAANAGMPSILVRHGPLGDGVDALAPEATLAQFEDLPEIVARLIH